MTSLGSHVAGGIDRQGEKKDNNQYDGNSDNYPCHGSSPLSANPTTVIIATKIANAPPRARRNPIALGEIIGCFFRIAGQFRKRR
jgi:hypothetical protein